MLAFGCDVGIVCVFWWGILCFEFLIIIITVMHICKLSACCSRCWKLQGTEQYKHKNVPWDEDYCWCLYMHVCVCTCMHVWMYVCVCACMRVCVCVCGGAERGGERREKGDYQYLLSPYTELRANYTGSKLYWHAGWEKKRWLGVHELVVCPL